MFLSSSNLLFEAETQALLAEEHKEHLAKPFFNLSPPHLFTFSLFHLFTLLHVFTLSLFHLFTFPRTQNAA